MAILATLRRDAAYQVGIFVSGDGTRGVPYRESLAGKTVAVVGLAKSGVAAARLLRRLGARVLASDSGPLESLATEARVLEREGCALWTGGHPEAAFLGAELVVVSPGVPLELPALAAVRGRGVPIIGELELAWRVMEADCIAITSHHVALDLQGNPITGPGAPENFRSGIHVKRHAHHVTIEGDGAAISRFASGIEIDGANVTARNLSADDNSTGVLIVGSISGTHTCDCGLFPLCPPPASHNSIEKGEASNNGTRGVLVSGGSENTVERVEANNNGYAGICVFLGNRNRIANFTADSNGCYGVDVSHLFCPEQQCIPPLPPAKHNSIEKGEASNNGAYGIDLARGSHRTRVTGNTTSANGTDDLFDVNSHCDHDQWKGNTFATSNQGCIQ